MRWPLAVVALLAACQDAPTMPAPARRSANAAPDAALLRSFWTVTRLPFTPRAINKNGVIVGTFAGEAVRWENGTMTILPHVSPSTVDDHAAVEISNTGKILGDWRLNALVWSSAAATPTVIPMAIQGAETYPIGIDDAGSIVASTYQYNWEAWRYSPSTGWRNITLPIGNRRWNTVSGMNATGYAVGTAEGEGVTYAVRWSPDGTATILPTFNGSTKAEAINSHGDVLGWSVLGATIWKADGSFVTIPELTSNLNVHGWSDAGRVVGTDENSGKPFTLYDGVLTYLPVLDDQKLPNLRGVNACGWIIGSGGGDYGYLWRQSSLLPCDSFK